MSSTDTSRQLDVFRGFAAVLMVLNHSGYGWLAPADSTSGADGVAVFLGSAAPALFFCATGIGMGLSRRRTQDWASVARKVVLLFVADLFLNWGVHHWLGLDFFGFCAVSMLAVAAVSASPRPRLAAGVAIAAILVLRYAFVGVLQPWAVDYPGVAFVTGIDGVPDVSYPLSPWLVFPLAGFLLGRFCAAHPDRRPTAFLAGLALLAGAAFAVLDARGAVVHRWNTVSIAYFLFAVAFVTAVWLLAGGLVASAREGAIRALALRGPASLLVVPVHYSLIGLAAAAVAPPWPPAAWPLAAAALCVVALASSKWIANCLRVAAESPAVSRWLPPALPIAALLIAWAAFSAPALVLLLAACAGEMLVAANLARPETLVTRARTARAL